MTPGIDDIRRLADDMEEVDLPDGLVPDDSDPAEDGGPAPDDPGPVRSIGEDPPEAQTYPFGFSDDPEEYAARDCAALPLNDIGNGRRLQAHFGQDLIWVPRVGWHVWDGRRWAADRDQIGVRRVAQELGPKIAAEIPHIRLSDIEMARLAERGRLMADLQAAESADDQDMALIMGLRAKLADLGDLAKRLSSLRREHRSWVRTSGNTGRIDAAIKEAGIGLAQALDALDADPLVVNTATATLRFRVSGGPGTGYSRTAEVEVLPHDRVHLLSKMGAVAYDPAAVCPTFDAFIAEVMPDEAVRGFLQRWMGLSMLGIREQRLVFNYGGGANGKSVFVDVLARILGDYAATAKIESLTGTNRRSGGDATPDLIPLIGARMVRASEPEEGQRLQEGKIKELTGGEPILVRALNADFVEVNPYFKLTISGNHKPEIRGTDDGIWRRVSLVPWDVTIAPERRDPTLGEKLFAEGPGILNWLIAGAVAYLEGGLQEPDAVKAATQEFREESDPIGTFLRTSCVVNGSERDVMSSADLTDAFNFWLDEQRMPRWSGATVAKRMRTASGRHVSADGYRFAPGKNAAGRSVYTGIRMTDLFQSRFDKRPRDGRAAVPEDRADDDWKGAF
jgi:putative DNA primase/helicase